MLLAGATLAAAAVGAGALGWFPAADPPATTPEPGIEQGRIGGTRLTRPFIEDPGVRDADPRLARFGTRVRALVDEGRRADPTLGVSVYLRLLEGGAWTGIDEDAPYVPASLMKVAVLFHVLSRLEADPSLAQRRIVYPGPAAMPSPDNLSGSAAPRHMTPGEGYTVEDLLERMVAHSDNHAKDLLLQGVDPAEVDTLMALVGVPALVDEDGRSVMTARAYAALFRLLYHSSVFSRATSEYALELLRRADFLEGLRAGLPADAVVASKYGVHFDTGDVESGQQLHECGIVYAPEGPFTLCVMTRSMLQPQGALAALVAQVAREAWFTLGPGT